MKKILTIFLGLILFSVQSLKAEEGQFRFGVELGWTPVEIEAEKIVIKEDSSGSVGSAFAVLGPNEWMFFPYGENDYLWVDAASGAPVIEYAIFEA